MKLKLIVNYESFGKGEIQISERLLEWKLLGRKENKEKESNND